MMLSREVNHLLLSMLTLNFKIVLETLVSVYWGVNHLLLSMLTLNFKIIPDTQVSDFWRGQSSFVVHANS